MNSSVRHVYKNLYVSGYEGPRKLGDEFDKIVSVATPCKKTDFTCLIPDGDHSYDKFKNSVDKTIEYLSQDRKVLVNCQAGLSRSVSICVTVQVCHYDIPYTKSLQNAQFGNRMPEPELLESANKYIAQNYNYTCQRVREDNSKRRIEIFCETLIERIESDDNIEMEDRYKKHIKDNLSEILENYEI